MSLYKDGKQNLSFIHNSILRYTIHATNTYLLKDIVHLKHVEQLENRIVTAVATLTHKEQLQQIYLFSFEQQKIWGDLILAYSIISRNVNLFFEEFFTPTHSSCLYEDVPTSLSFQWEKSSIFSPYSLFPEITY